MLQLATAAIVGLAFLTQGYRDAIAAAAGAALVALGTALLASRTFAGLGGGGMTMGRMVSGMVLKWIAIAGGRMVILGQYRLPPLAAITGLVASYAINLLAFRFTGGVRGGEPQGGLTESIQHHLHHNVGSLGDGAFMKLHL